MSKSAVHINSSVFMRAASLGICMKRAADTEREFPEVGRCADAQGHWRWFRSVSVQPHPLNGGVVTADAASHEICCLFSRNRSIRLQFH